MKNAFLIFFILSTISISLFGNSYECTFTKKFSYSNWQDNTPNKTSNVNLKVIYRITGNELLTRPKGQSRTYSAYFQRKDLDKNGKLSYMFKANNGYVYFITEGMSSVIELTPSGKTGLMAYNCRPLY